ncbi:F-box/kelch-repeat protein-like [Dorcoceras hygrometricum]|uniref:F-box/kelch-repeat protein-like n=1 Tax=Dorcoceras hygrometricum TaxID=472368 RepID=A0A2Z7BUR5_9LAMI|nr:F-box/kelch-repeat protein-like [Dorcoceras hygrometricum]
MRIRPPELETSICDAKYHVSLSTGCVLGKWVCPVTLAMSLFDLQDVCIVIGSLATLDLPMVVDLIGIYALKGPYCTLTTTNWFLQELSVIPRGSWGDVARSFTMIRWTDEGILIPVVDLIKENLSPPTLKYRIPCESGRSQAPRRQQGPPGTGPKQTLEVKNSVATPPRVRRTAAARRRPPLAPGAAHCRTLRAAGPAIGTVAACSYNAAVHPYSAAVRTLQRLFFLFSKNL